MNRDVKFLRKIQKKLCVCGWGGGFRVGGGGG